jgi:hypothetical protein
METTHLGKIELIYVSEEQVLPEDGDRIQSLKHCVLNKSQSGGLSQELR